MMRPRPDNVWEILGLACTSAFPISESRDMYNKNRSIGFGVAGTLRVWGLRFVAKGSVQTFRARSYAVELCFQDLG